MKKNIEVLDYATEILKQVKIGALMTVEAEGKVNPMTIAWGMLGIEWEKPLFIAVVRESRYTKELLDKNPVFTVNIPYGKYNAKILSLCGTKTGRDIDKIAELGLTLEKANKISAPAIKELPLTLECKVVYKVEHDIRAIPQDVIDDHYPKVENNPFCTADVDMHTIYYGEIVASYIIE